MNFCFLNLALKQQHGRKFVSVNSQVFDINLPKQPIFASIKPTSLTTFLASVAPNIETQIMASYNNLKNPAQPEVVEMTGLVAMKIIKHCQEEGQAADVQGVLLGMLNTGNKRLEVTNCYPVPRHTDEEEGEESDYNFIMMKHLRNVNVDQLHVGWYQCSPFGSSLNKMDSVDLQHMNQNTVEESVVIMYDPVRTQRGFLSLRAYRLTNNALAFCKEGECTSETLQKHNMSFDRFFEEIPIVIKNSTLTNLLICEMQKHLEPDEGKQFLDMGTITSLEKSLYNLTKCVEEATRWAHHQRNLLAKQQQVQRENAARLARGEPPLTEEEVNKIVRPMGPIQRLEASLNYAQTLNYCQQSSTFATENIAKLFVARALQPNQSMGKPAEQKQK